MKAGKMEKVDKTIDALCDWIQIVLNSEVSVEKNDLSEMVKALAELVSARGSRFTHHV